MMAINRYRLKYLVKNRHKAARRVNKLLARTDKLLGVILIGNNNFLRITRFQRDPVNVSMRSGHIVGANLRGRGVPITIVDMVHGRET